MIRRILGGGALAAAVAVLLSPALPGGEGDRPAVVIVHLPEKAKLFVESAECPLKSAVRSFKTPPLKADKSYEYTLRVEITHDGRPVGATATAVLTAGKETVVRFGDERAILAAAGHAPPPDPKPPEPTRLPAGPPPYLVYAERVFGNTIEIRWPGAAKDKAKAAEFNAYTVTELPRGGNPKPEPLRDRLWNPRVVAVAADAKPPDPFYVALLAPDTPVLIPMDPFPSLPAPREQPHFGLAQVDREGKYAIHWIESPIPTERPLGNDGYGGFTPHLVKRSVRTERSIEVLGEVVTVRDRDAKKLTLSPLQPTAVLVMEERQKVGADLLKALAPKCPVVVVSVGLVAR